VLSVWSRNVRTLGLYTACAWCGVLISTFGIGLFQLRPVYMHTSMAFGECV
jgi:hypothetical protein